MRNTRKIIAILLLLVGLTGGGRKAFCQYYHSASDTVMAMEIVESLKEPGGNPAGKIGRVAEKLVGLPYGAVTEEDSVCRPLLRFDEFDDLTFLATAAGLARTATSPGHTRPIDCLAAINEFIYRRGEDKGFASKMIYGADWALDTKARGLVKEMTENYSDQYRTKSLDKVTRERSRYAALRDSDTYEAQRMVEMGFRTHKIPHMKRESTEWKQVAAELQDGDIIMLLTPDDRTDTYEVGILRKRDDGLHLIHPSAEAGKVVEEKETIGRYIRRNAKKVYGYRWLRLAK